MLIFIHMVLFLSHIVTNWLTCAVISIWTWGKVASCDSVIARHRLQLDLFSSFCCDRYNPLQYLRKGNNIKIHPNMPQYILKMLAWTKHFSSQLRSIYYGASPLLCYKLPYFCLCPYFTLTSSDSKRYKKKKILSLFSYKYAPTSLNMTFESVTLGVILSSVYPRGAGRTTCASYISWCNKHKDFPRVNSSMCAANPTRGRLLSECFTIRQFASPGLTTGRGSRFAR